MERNPVIDLLRGWAIIGMTLWHALMWLGQVRCDAAACQPLHQVLWDLVFYNGSSLSVPLFFFAAGMTLALNVERQRQRRVVARAVVVVLIGYALTLFVMGPQQWLHAFVLQGIGCSLLLALVVSRWRWGFLALYAAAVAATLYNLGRSQVLVPDFSTQASLWPVLWEGVRALAIDGGFAVLPWVGFLALGFGVYRESTQAPRSFLPFGALAVPLGLALGVAKYPMSPGYLLCFSGLAVLAALVLSRYRVALAAWLDRSRVGRIWAGLSRYSLEIFVIHYLLGHGIATWFPGWRLSFGGALSLGVGFLMLVALLLLVRDRRAMALS